MVGIRSWIAVALLILGIPVLAQERPAEMKLTQRYLEPVCLDGAPVKAGDRNWKLGAGAHTLALTMRNDPRPGVEANGVPGVAEVSFTLEAAHTYEVEVRASTAAFATRVWERAEWTPVVRDRTADRIISTEPQWRVSGCVVPR